MRLSRPASALFSAVIVGALLASTLTAQAAPPPGGRDGTALRPTPGGSTHRITLVTVAETSLVPDQPVHDLHGHGMLI